MKKTKAKLTFFFERHPAIDEYALDTFGLFARSYCVIGIWKARYAPQFAIVILNHAIGFWLEES